MLSSWRERNEKAPAEHDACLTGFYATRDSRRVGFHPAVRLLSPATVRAMTSNQLMGLPAIPEEERRCRPSH